jgi:hypothetical protein
MAAVLSLAVPHPVAADPAKITSGVITAQGPFIGETSARFRLEGDTFSLEGLFQDGGAEGCTSICFAGFTGTSLFWGGDIGHGSGTVDGTFYPSLFFSSINFSVGGTYVLPPDGPSRFSITFPFSVTAGSILGDQSAAEQAGIRSRRYRCWNG